MGNDEVLIAVALISAIIVLITVKIIEFFIRFNDDTRYITLEMRRAYDDGEYRYWRRELRCHYLCLIPFVSERNVMWLYKRIYHKAKHDRSVKRSDGLYHILAPSAVGICICAVAFAVLRGRGSPQPKQAVLRVFTRLHTPLMLLLQSMKLRQRLQATTVYIKYHLKAIKLTK